MTVDTNPFRPPTAEVQLAPEAIAENQVLAGKGRRFGTAVIDYGGYIAMCAIVGGLLGAVLGPRVTVLFTGGGSYVFGILVLLAYYVFFEGLWARTPGKMLLGTKVTDLQGRPPTLGRVVGRTLARFMPFEAFTFLGSNGFHDRASKTRVVRTR